MGGGGTGRRLRAVTFDFWNTLIAEQPDVWQRRLAAQHAALERAGVEVTIEEVETAVGGLRRWFDEEWHANRVVNPEIGARRLMTLLGLPEDAPAASEVAELFLAGGDPAHLRTAPGIGDALEALRSAGLRIGIICDAGFSPGVTLRRYLEHHGLLGHFDHWSFSDEVGAFKPDVRMFTHAAEGLGIDEPAALAHVGDLRRTDVGGARAAGWTAVRYRGLHDDAPAASLAGPPDDTTGSADPDDAHHVIDHHDDLPAVLLP